MRRRSRKQRISWCCRSPSRWCKRSGLLLLVLCSSEVSHTLGPGSDASASCYDCCDSSSYVVDVGAIVTVALGCAVFVLCWNFPVLFLNLYRTDLPAR